MAIATILLAAGASSRLGGPAKQLFQIGSESLVRHMARLALALAAGPVVVVVGARRADIEAELTDLPVQVVANPTWADGMASSLQAGLRALDAETTDSFLVLLTDQPYVGLPLLRQLIDTQRQTGRGIVASRYAEPGGHLGVPALFDRHYRAEFLRLTGDVGARKLIRQYEADCAEVLFPLAAIDLDTPDDVRRWQARQHQQ